MNQETFGVATAYRPKYRGRGGFRGRGGYRGGPMRGRGGSFGRGIRFIVSTAVLLPVADLGVIVVVGTVLWTIRHVNSVPAHFSDLN